MTAWPGVTYWYVSIDSVDDIGNDQLQVGLAAGSYLQTAEPVTAPSDELAARLASAGTPAAGMTRYWWRVLLGGADGLAVQSGSNKIHGQLTDNPEILPQTWTVSLPWP